MPQLDVINFFYLTNTLASLYLLGYLFVILHLLKPVCSGRFSFFTSLTFTYLKVMLFCSSRRRGASATCLDFSSKTGIKQCIVGWV